MDARTTTHIPPHQKLKDTIYDTAIIFITTIDIAIDILMTYYFYINNHFTFFLISCSILLITQLAYALTFSLKFTLQYSMIDRCFIFFILLPLSPMIPAIFYYSAHDNQRLTKLFKSCKLNTNTIENQIKNGYEMEPNKLWSQENIR